MIEEETEIGKKNQIIAKVVTETKNQELEGNVIVDESGIVIVTGIPENGLETEKFLNEVAEMIEEEIDHEVEKEREEIAEEAETETMKGIKDQVEKDQEREDEVDPKKEEGVDQKNVEAGQEIVPEIVPKEISLKNVTVKMQMIVRKGRDPVGHRVVVKTKKKVQTHPILIAYKTGHAQIVEAKKAMIIKLYLIAPI